MQIFAGWGDGTLRNFTPMKWYSVVTTTQAYEVSCVSETKIFDFDLVFC